MLQMSLPDVLAGTRRMSSYAFKSPSKIAPTLIGSKHKQYMDMIEANLQQLLTHILVVVLADLNANVKP